MASRWTADDVRLLKAGWDKHAYDWPFWRTYLPKKTPEQIVSMARDCGMRTSPTATVKARGSWTRMEDNRALAYFGAMQAAGHSPEACAKRYCALIGGDA